MKGTIRNSKKDMRIPNIAFLENESVPCCRNLATKSRLDLGTSLKE